MIFQEISQSAVNPGDGVINFPEKKLVINFPEKKLQHLTLEIIHLSLLMPPTPQIPIPQMGNPAYSN